MQHPTSSFVKFAQERRSVREVAGLIGCDLRTAKERMEDARASLTRRQANLDGAVQIILHSGLSVPKVHARLGDRPCRRWGAWQDVALGLKKAA